jgi:hypothetical protein
MEVFENIGDVCFLMPFCADLSPFCANLTPVFANLAPVLANLSRSFANLTLFWGGGGHRGRSGLGGQ